MKTNLQSLSRGELLFVGVITLCLLVAIGFLIMIGSLRRGPIDAQAIGTVTFKNKVAERKVTGEVLWDGVVQNSIVYNLDTIRTSANSSAMIHLKNKIEISLGEESLILLDLGTEVTRLNVSGSSVIVHADSQSGESSSSAKPLVELSTAAGIVSLKSGTMSVVDSGSGVSLHLKDGVALLSNKAGDQSLSGDAIVGSNGVVVSPAIIPVYPANGDVLLVKVGHSKIPFRWQSVNQKVQKAKLLLAVASDQKFSHLEFQGTAADSLEVPDLGSGTHYWRVLDPADPAGVSSSSWFVLNIVSPPILIGPLNQSYRISPGRLAAVDFMWTTVESAMAYRIDIFNRDSPDKPLFSSTTSLSNLTVDSLKTGEYSWNVRSLSGPNQLESQSESGTFRVVESAVPSAIIRPPNGAKLGSPDTKFQVSTTGIHNGVIIAGWDSVEGADHYIATISRDSEGHDIVQTITTQSNYLQLKTPLEKGTYYIRVQTVDHYDLSQLSDSMLLEVTGPLPPNLIEPTPEAQLEPFLPEIHFRWSDSNQAKNYRLQIATDSGFQKVIADRVVSGREISLSLGQVASNKLYWKISVLDDSQHTLIDSAVASFMVLQALDSPHVVSPSDGSELDINQIEKIVFNWKTVGRAQLYHLDLYRMTAGLKSKVQSWQAEQPAVVLDHFEDLAVGLYAWDLQAFDDGSNGFLAKSKPVSSFFRIFQSSPLEAPKVSVKTMLTVHLKKASQ